MEGQAPIRARSGLAIPIPRVLEVSSCPLDGTEDSAGKRVGSRMSSRSRLSYIDSLAIHPILPGRPFGLSGIGAKRSPHERTFPCPSFYPWSSLLHYLY